MNAPQPGDKGADVKTLQGRLIGLGYAMPKYGADGDFSAKTTGETMAAVMAWQRDNLVDGTLSDEEFALLMGQVPESVEAKEMEFAPVYHGQRALVAAYGKPWDDVNAFWQEWGAACKLPPELARLTRRGVVWVHKDLVAPLSAALEDVCDAGLASKIKTYHGCYNVRKVRGSATQRSTHTWGLAVDFNAATNGLGMKPTMDPGVVEAFTSRGFVWGGKFRRKDGMHFQRVTGM